MLDVSDHGHLPYTLTQTRSLDSHGLYAMRFTECDKACLLVGDIALLRHVNPIKELADILNEEKGVIHEQVKRAWVSEVLSEVGCSTKTCTTH